jgi:hypothetical protein
MAAPAPSNTGPADCQVLADAVCLRLSDCGVILGRDVGASHCQADVEPVFNCARATGRGRNYQTCREAIPVYDCARMTYAPGYLVPIGCDGSVVGGGS